jgi:HD-GYP domain-containing protein (c-di-GMP phosphodiesterase class II)
MLENRLEGVPAPFEWFNDVIDALHHAGDLSGKSVVRPHPSFAAVMNSVATVIVAPADVWRHGRSLLKPFASALAEGTANVVLVGDIEERELGAAMGRGLASVIPRGASVTHLVVAVLGAFEILDAKSRAESRGRWLNRYRYELGELIEISRALSTEREIDKLLDLILEKSRFITSADAGSIYVVEGDDPSPTRRTLRFKLTQNESIRFDWREFTIPISARSMSGYVALHKAPLNIADVYDLPAQSPFGFDRSFDAKIGYRTKSMLCAPLLARNGDVIGVIQLINKKRDPNAPLTRPEDVDRSVIAFDERSEELLMTLASQAGIALENAILYNEISTMLEGFVRASVEAIEQRDPTTSGHSRRVADLTVGLAQAVERSHTGPFGDVRWTKDELRELEYASLLHDFGKIGVREEVLVKAKKLYTHELDAIRARFDFVICSLDADLLRRKIFLMERGAGASDIKRIEEEALARRMELEAAFQAVVHANEPTILKGGDFEKIEAVSRETYSDLAGSMNPLLTSDEVRCLSVTRGSLTPTEIDEIRSHVTHTIGFLKQIPWGKQFQRVAHIAGAHHERLNGSGYPNRLHAAEIPLQSKMMSISDIFDALTASDRPYKKAVPIEKALDILGYEVKDQHVDADLLQIFIEARVWDGVIAPRSQNQK